MSDVSPEEIDALKRNMEAGDLATLDFVDDPFDLLTPAELELVEYARNGKQFNRSTKDPQGADPANAEELWDEERKIRAAVVSTLSRGVREDWPVHHSGLQLKGVWLTGELNLDAATVQVPLRMMRCYFDSRPTFQDARLRLLDLDGSRLPGLSCERMQVTGSVYLGDKFVATGCVWLVNASIEGNLNCDLGEFLGSEYEPFGRLALSCDGMRVGGSALLRNVSASGEVRLLNVALGGNLECDGGTFSNAPGKAMSCDGMEVSGSVHLRGIKDEDGNQVRRFAATGQVDLVSASVGGSVECRDGTCFKCDPGSDRSEPRLGLNLAFMRAANLWWREVDVGPCTYISFRDTHVNVLSDDEDSWPEVGHLLLNGFTYTELGIGSPQEPNMRLDWIKLNHTFEPQPYEQLISVYRAVGQEQNAKTIAIAKQQARRHSGALKRWQRPFHLLFGAIGYGHEPYKAIWAMALIIAVGSLIYLAAQEGDVMTAAQSDTATVGDCTRTYPCFQPFIYSLDATVPIINLEQRVYWLPDHSTAPGRWVQVWMWFTLVAGWLLTTLFVASVTGLIRRD